jgi:dTDP-4-dehydrorhamnose reductase
MKQKVLILGVEGMVGHKLFLELSKKSLLKVWATARTQGGLAKFPPRLASGIIPKIDAGEFETVVGQLNKLKPDVVINCIGITKKIINENDPLSAIEINSVFPHRLAQACRLSGARVIQLATDCVFNGSKGNYTESDPSDATDLYGRTKYLGEVYYPHCLTIRTSFVGPELGTRHHGLLEWFLSQRRQTKGYTKAIYSGVPTVEIARILYKYILPNKKLRGLYQISSVPISKFDLLKLIAKVYSKKINIIPDDSVSIDRSLDSKRFRLATGYKPLSWERMIKAMHQDYKSQRLYKKYN